MTAATMTYVLILLAQLGARGGVAFTTVEFTSNEACQAALLDAKKGLSGFLSAGISGVCVKKQ